MNPSGGPVLIVEDDPDVRELLVHRFKRLGYEPHAVGSGEEALHAASEAVPQLAVVDILLPGMNGWELIRRLRSNAKTADVPVLVATIIDKPQAEGLPDIEGFLVKPFKARDLESALDEIDSA